MDDIEQIVAQAAKRRKAARKPEPQFVIEAVAGESMPVVETLAIEAAVEPAPEPAPRSAEAPAPSAPPAAASAVIQEDETMATVIENTTHDFKAKTETMVADMGERTKGAMEKGAKMVEDMAAFNKGNLEAMVESGKIAARGMEQVGQDLAAQVKAQFEQGTAAMKTLASVKSPTEFMQVQSNLLRQSFDQMVQAGSRSTETMLKLAGEVAQPISNRFAVAASQMKVAA